MIFAADEIMRSEVWDDIRDELVAENKWPETHPWNLVIKMSTFGNGDSKRSHWWYLHVLAPAQKGGKELVKSLEGTSLVPSPDGMFGGTVSTSVSGASSSAGQPPQSVTRARPNRRARSNRGWNQQGGKGNSNGINGNNDHAKGSSSTDGWHGGNYNKGKDNFSRRAKVKATRAMEAARARRAASRP